MIKINPDNKPANVDINRTVQTPGEEKKVFEGGLSPDTGPKIYSRDNLINAIQGSKSIEDAIKAISGDVVEQIFEKSSLFGDEIFISRMKEELFQYFKNDPFAQEILHSIK